jgi:AAA family ATP:ADP antiporter
MLWVSLLSVVATFLYFEQAAIVAAVSDDPATRTRIFATVDLVVGVLTILVQFAATGKLIARFGVGAALALLPFVFAAGFAALAAAPVLAAVIAFQALQRTANFAISNPAREVLFTVVARDEKYKAKNVIDIVAVRGADAAGGWFFTALRSLGMEARGLSLAAIGIAAACLALAVALGREQERRSAAPREV